MTTYVDANALVRYYLMAEGRADMTRALSDPKMQPSLPVPVTTLVRFEVLNAIERMVFETRNGGTARTSPELALVAQDDFETDLRTGTRFQLIPLTLTDIETEFDTLARRHTAPHGFRTYDVIHVASALKLRCKRFLSFDAKANALAKLVGLKTL